MEQAEAVGLADDVVVVLGMNDPSVERGNETGREVEEEASVVNVTVVI